MRHAYLIIAHNQFELLKSLIMLLQRDNTDIYLHIDKKVSLDKVKKILQPDLFHNLYIIQKHAVTWGGHSQIKCEMSLIREALSNDTYYDYLHIISGVDLPIKSPDYIDAFFEKNKGKEFIYFDKELDMNNTLSRCREYHFFQDVIGRKESGLLADFERILIGIQKKLNVNRVKKIEPFLGKGANWVSITTPFARFVLENEKSIRHYFRYTRCADEVFLHTFFNMSPYKDNLYVPTESEEIDYSNMVYTDWKRGNPYVLQSDDLVSLVKSPYLFARKFDSNISIDLLKELIS